MRTTIPSLGFHQSLSPVVLHSLFPAIVCQLYDSLTGEKSFFFCYFVAILLLLLLAKLVSVAGYLCCYFRILEHAPSFKSSYVTTQIVCLSEFI